MLTSEEIHGIVGEGRVNRRLYTDPTLFNLELRTIFRNAWIYVGHESQVRKRGDFFTSQIGHERVIVARHGDDSLYAFHNRCAHRGAEVCPQASGNTNAFVCPYHAWSYHTDGSLASMPLPKGYDDFQARKGEFGLERVPRLASYKGFLFASLRPDGVDLETFLGAEVRSAFDNFVDRAPGGEVDLAGGKTVQQYRANWKLQIENSIDLLHPRVLHWNAVDSAIKLAEKGGPLAMEFDAVRVNGLTFGEWDQLRISALPRGHCWMGGFIPKPEQAIDDEAMVSEEMRKATLKAAYKDALVRRHGAAKTEDVLAYSRHNTIVYPNLFVNPLLQQIRALQPVAVDRTEQHGYVFRLKGAPEEIFRIAIRLLNMANSPASIVTTDDHEVFERIQESMVSGDRDWIDWSRGMGREKPSGSGQTGDGTSEILMRNQHKAWAGYMSGAL